VGRSRLARESARPRSAVRARAVPRIQPAKSAQTSRSWRRWAILVAGVILVGGTSGIWTAVAASGGSGAPAAVPVVTTPTSPFPNVAPALPPLGAGVTSAWESVACPNASGCVAVGMAADGTGTASLTSDGGSSWSGASLPVALPALTGVACSDQSHCVAVGQGTAVESQDAGATWHTASIPSTTGSLLSVACPTATTCVAVGRAPGTMAGLAGVILQSTDAGQTWQRVINGIPAMDAVTCPSTNLCIAVGEIILVSRDSGSTWNLRAVSGGAQTLTGLACPTSTRCLAVGGTSAGNINNSLTGFGVATSDGGATWHAVTMPPGSWNLERAMCISSTTCFATGALPTAATPLPFELSQDGGDTWSAGPPPPGLSDLQAISCMTAMHCIGVGATSSGPASVVTNDGSSWTTPIGAAQ